MYASNKASPPIWHGRRGPHSSSHRMATSFAVLMLMALSTICTTPASSQWSTQSPIPTFLDVRGVAAPSSQRVFVATNDDTFDDGGALFESLDGGASWVQRNVPFSLGSPLNGIFFLDALNGWVYGNVNYRTTDGGTTWTELPILGSVYSMEFYTSGFGLASGNFDHFVSHDGGLSWEPSPHDIFAFDFADSQLGLGVADSSLYRTTDGGTNFAEIRVGDASAAAFLSGTEAVAIVEDSFLRSTDAGETWSVGASAEGRTILEVISSDAVLAWRGNGILRSGDGGRSWTDLGQVMSAGGFAFTVVDEQTVVAADVLGNMYRSADAGLTWSQTFTSPGPRPSFLSSAGPVFDDTLTGYFGYGAGFVIKTLDGGTTWSQISSGSGLSLNALDRFENGDMIAVGETGTVLTRRLVSNTAPNGAITTPWALHPALTMLDLMAVDVVGPFEVVAVDEAGQVYRSDDAGSTWTTGDATPPGLDANDLDFTTLLDGWVTGTGFGSAAVFHTTDGGDSWTPVPGFLGAYVAVDFESAYGWAANVSGRFYRTTDDGANWIEEDLPGSPLNIQDMDFYDVSIGYAVGRWGYAARSDDGGLTWEILPIPNDDDMLTDIFLLGPNELWVSTNDNVAYYTATGGQNWARLDIGSQGFSSFSGIVATPEGDAWTAGFRGYVEHFQGPPPPPLNRPPEASFDFVTTGMTVDLTDTSIDPDGEIVSWLWDFGDSTGSTDQHTSHTFDTADTYHVRLTVTDDDGETGGALRFITVQPGPGGTFGDFTEVTPLDPLFVTPQDEDFWVATTAPADYDGDGDLDIAVLGFYVVYHQSVEERLVLLRNDGLAGAGEWDFTYIDVPLGDLSSGASDLAWGDVDNDGDEDLAVGTDGQTVIYRNDGDGTLVATDTELPGYYEDNDQADFDLHSISWADFDNDGDLDLLLPSIYVDSTFSFHTALMRNDGPNGSGGWNFTDVDAGFAPTGHAQSAWADFDDDHDLDLLLVHLAPLTDDGFIRRYRNDGDGGFVGEDILGDLTIEHGEAQWGDYDGDGDFDILVAGHIKELDGSFNRVLRIYRNDDGTYVPIEVVDCIPCEGWFDLTAATWADYDSDGDVDILLTGTYNSGSQIEGRAKIFANDGGLFTDSGNDLPAPRSSGTRGGTFSWLDIDGEFDLDYFIAGSYFVPGGNGLVEAQMHLYRNDVQSQNAAPQAPTGLSAVVEEGGGPGGGSTVYFSWSPASDDQTPVAALTYDLDLYVDGIPVANPRPLPEPGDVSSVTEWALHELPHGDYRWTLRTVDSAYNSSAEAEGVFSVGSTTDAPAIDAVSQSFDVVNHPNPFRSSTSFRFALPVQSEVELVVYDVHGRLVKTLVDDTRAAGIYEVHWDAGDMASGAYYARFSTEDFSETRRILLVK